MHYIASFLPNLAEHTVVLTPLTAKEFEKKFPEWNLTHQHAFEAIKALVVRHKCLTVIDANAGDNKIFINCDASDLRTGAILSWGMTWENAHPIAFDSMQLKDAQKNYPVHKKEMLVIVCALKKWCLDLLGSQILVYSDHCTLEIFKMQKDLSHQQVQWMEYFSQFDMTIVYIWGEDNIVADALSHMPEVPGTNETEDVDVTDPTARWDVWTKQATINSVLKIMMDETFLWDICKGYTEDEFFHKLSVADSSIPGVQYVNGLWYIGDRLVIPHYGMLHEDIFQLAHDSLGHFGGDKSYGTIRKSYY